MSSHTDRPCAEVYLIARRHLAEVERRIGQLSALKDDLTRMVSACSHGRVAECRVIEVLSDHAKCAAVSH